VTAAKGLALPPHRFAELSAAFSIPHGGEGQQQHAQARQS
jgi:hypothetical protein